MNEIDSLTKVSPFHALEQPEVGTFSHSGPGNFLGSACPDPHRRIYDATATDFNAPWSLLVTAAAHRFYQVSQLSCSMNELFVPEQQTTVINRCHSSTIQRMQSILSVRSKNASTMQYIEAYQQKDPRLHHQQ